MVSPGSEAATKVVSAAVLAAVLAAASAVASAAVGNSGVPATRTPAGQPPKAMLEADHPSLSPGKG